MTRLTTRAALRAGCALALCIVVALAGMAPGSVASAAQPLTPQVALERLMTAPHYSAGWFAPAFLAVVTPAQLEAGRTTTLATLGPYVRVQPQPDGSFVIVCRKGTVAAQIHLDAQGRIDGLRFGVPQLSHLTAAAALRELRG